MNDNQKKAAVDYAAGMKYKDIAEKYGVSLNTVKSWRKRNGWSRGAPLNKKGAPKTSERVHPKNVPKVIEKSDATEKQKMFALYYLQRFNATWAYMQAYGGKYTVANVEGPRLLVNPSVKDMIDELKAEQAAELHISKMDVLNQAAKQMGANIGDYIDFGSEEVPMTDKQGKKIIDPDTGKQRTKRVSRVTLRDKSEVDTSLLKSVRVGKDGVIVEINDPQKAMDMLLKNLPDTVITTGNDDDGFLTAIDEAGEKAWGDDDGSS
ncbi:terminase small subunit [Loigolactobacillus coryniformis]|uniref:terminase small subunit n=1 Tax=Loigolactobacillus coryniformis TaxID=1610 RepID=UPI001C5DF3D8|nr:terminase small subunit [Loigolactobacillus coryniformis]MBW4802890.1 terminase small subunit [Loigolactobacillus coryniformis subsp. torquens]MBW4805580.1 terminase small subunit [Loigolactobacillus coryniformis subsp. torquens]